MHSLIVSLRVPFVGRRRRDDELSRGQHRLGVRLEAEAEGAAASDRHRGGAQGGEISPTLINTRDTSICSQRAVARNTTNFNCRTIIELKLEPYSE